MNDESDLKGALRRLAEILPRDVSTAAEQRMLAAFRARKRRSRRLWAYGAAAAACFGLILGWFLEYHSVHVSHTPAMESLTNDPATAGFVALPYAQSGVPLEETVIVRVRLRPSELGILGVQVPPARATGSVSADLLIGQDGVARAVRLVDQ
jgi:hypothetical protein